MKVFISQPMNNKTEREIRQERKRLRVMAQAVLDGEDVEIIDSYFPITKEVDKPLLYLGKGIELMAAADVVVFAKGWQEYRGCRIEHSCALEYGIRIIEL